MHASKLDSGGAMEKEREIPTITSSLHSLIHEAGEIVEALERRLLSVTPMPVPVAPDRVGGREILSGPSNPPAQTPLGIRLTEMHVGLRDVKSRLVRLLDTAQL